jgi:hypothetical protein
LLHWQGEKCPGESLTPANVEIGRKKCGFANISMRRFFISDKIFIFESENVSEY